MVITIAKLATYGEKLEQRQLVKDSECIKHLFYWVYIKVVAILVKMFAIIFLIINLRICTLKMEYNLYF